MRTRTCLTALVFTLGSAAMGCQLRQQDEGTPISRTQATQALEATHEANEAGDLLNASTELSTHFTLGQAAEQAAQELRTFVTSQLPCAEVELDDRTLTVTYGAKPGTCTYRGQTFTGQHSMTLLRFDTDGAEVAHRWTQFSNGKVTLDGTADVTWTRADVAYHSVEQYDWQRLVDGRHFSAQVEQTLGGLNGDFTQGVTWEGGKRWSSDRGNLELKIEGVEARWMDPVPQAGTMILTGLKDGAATLEFERIDDDTIRVSIEGGGQQYSVDVNRLGAVSTPEAG